MTFCNQSHAVSDHPIAPNSSKDLRNLADIKREILILGLGDRQTADLVSALHAVAQLKQIDHPNRKIEEALELIPLDPRSLLPMLEASCGARLGYTKKAWLNIRCLIKKALKVTGAWSIINAKNIARSPEWLRALDLLPNDIRKSSGMRIPSAWGSLNNIGPAEFGSNHMAAVETWLALFTPPSRLRDEITNVVRSWNRAVDEIPAWPGKRFKIASMREAHYSVPKDQWPQELHDEIKKIAHDWRFPDPDVLEGSMRPLSETTAKNSVIRLYRTLSAYVAATGRQPEDVKSVAVLINPEATKATLDFTLEWVRKKKPKLQKSFEVAGAANLIVKLARERFRKQIGVDDMYRLEKMAKVRRPAPGGMAKASRALLKQFDDEDLVMRFLAAPRQVFNRLLQKKSHGWLQKNEIMLAFATILSMHAPLRSINMCDLKIGPNVNLHDQNGIETLYIHVPSDGVKNNLDLDFELTGEVVDLYKLYMAHAYGSQNVEPLYLFRGRSHDKKSGHALSRQIARFLEREIGIYMTSHKFRHLTGYLYLKDNPGDYETVRQLLGHKDIQTTMTYYAAMEMRAASERVNAFFDQKRKQLPPRIRRRKGKIT